MSALRVVECIVPWLNALPLDKLAPANEPSSFQPLDTQLLLPLFVLSRHHLCAFGVAAHHGLESLWRALMRCPLSSILPAAASWQAKQVQMASSPVLLERQRENIRTVLHFMLRLPLLTSFAPFLNPTPVPFDFASLVALVSSESNAALATANVPELRSAAKKRRTAATAAASSSERVRNEANEAALKAEEIANAAASQALKELRDRKLLDPKALSQLVPMQEEHLALFRHLVAHADSSLIAICRLLVRALFHSNAETVLHTLFLYLSDATGSSVPPEGTIFPIDDDVDQPDLADGAYSKEDESSTVWLRTRVSRASHVPNVVRLHLMRSMATRLVHDAVLLQFSHQAASLHLLLSHTLIALQAPNTHAQPLLGYLLSYLAPRQGSPSVAANCSKLAERAQQNSLDFAWHAHILPLAATAVARGPVGQLVLHEIVDSLQRQRRGVERISIEHVVLIAAEWAKAKFDHVLDMWGAEALRIAVASACPPTDSVEAADAADTRQAAHALRLYGCLLQPARSAEVLQLGSMLRRVMANGLRLWKPFCPPGQLTLSLSTDGPVYKQQAEQGRNSLQVLGLLLEVMHHMALTFYAEGDLASLAPPNANAVLGNSSSSQGSELSAYATSVCTPIGARVSSARSASFKSVLTPMQTEDGAVSAASSPGLAMTSLFSTLSSNFSDAFVRIYTSTDGRVMAAVRPWNTDAFLMYCQLFWMYVLYPTFFLFEIIFDCFSCPFLKLSARLLCSEAIWRQLLRWRCACCVL